VGKIREARGGAEKEGRGLLFSQLISGFGPRRGDARLVRGAGGVLAAGAMLRNRNTVEFLGIWESVFNPDFNYGEFAIIKSQAGLNSYKLSVKECYASSQLGGPRQT
jgi:hypothetical protein